MFPVISFTMHVGCCDGGEDGGSGGCGCCCGGGGVGGGCSCERSGRVLVVH